jgi:hypothetical protein
MRNAKTLLIVGAAALLVACGGHSKSKRGFNAAAATSSTTTSLPTATSTSPVASSGDPLQLSVARAEHAALLLDSGQVFVVGGVGDGGNVLASTALIGPSGQQVGPDMSTPRVGHTLTLLPNGEVLIAGGTDAAGGAPLASTEVFDPDAGTLRPGPDLQEPRAGHAAVFADGTVFLAGGWQPGAGAGSYSATIERVSVDAGVSELVGVSLSEGQAGLSAVALDPAYVVFVGGQGSGGPVAGEVLDVQQVTLQPLPGSPLRAGMAVASGPGELLLLGGSDQGTLADRGDYFDGQGFQPILNAGAVPRRDATAEPTGSGILIVGGVDDMGPSDAVEFLDASGFSSHTSLTQARRAHTLTVVGARAFVVGGYDDMDRPLRSVEILDLLAPSASGPALPAPAPALPGQVDLTTRELATLMRVASAPGAKRGKKAKNLKKRLARLRKKKRGKATGPCNLVLSVDGPSLVVGLMHLTNATKGHGKLKQAQDLKAPVEGFLTSIGVADPAAAALCTIKHLSAARSNLGKKRGKALARLKKGLKAANKATPLDAATHTEIQGQLEGLAKGAVGADEVVAKIRSRVPAVAKGKAKHADRQAIRAIRLFDRFAGLAPAGGAGVGQATPGIVPGP